MQNASASAGRGVMQLLPLWLIAAATLTQEILLVRFVSAKLLNNLAFLVISVTMLGFSIAAVAQAIIAPRVLPQPRRWLSMCFSLHVMSTIAAWSFFAHLTPPAAAAPGQARTLELAMASLPYALVLAVPFVFSGFAIGIYLSLRDVTAHRSYATDLFGSAAGCVLGVGAIGQLGVEMTQVLTCLGVAIGGAVLLWPSARAARVLALGAVVLSVSALSMRERWFALSYAPGSFLALVADEPGAEVENVLWDPVARVELTRLPRALEQNEWPSLAGDDPALHRRIDRILTQNNYAFTFAPRYDGDPSALGGLKRTIYGSGYELIAARGGSARAVVIGVGGGIDLLTALVYDAQSVTGVEINGATLSLVTRDRRDHFGPWVNDPRVTLVHAEGRHYISASTDQFDLIQLSGVDSYSATDPAAHMYSETFLYTHEAFIAFLEHLSPRGVLNVMRLEHKQPREVMRLIATAADALRSLGVENPARHIAVVGQSDREFMAVLVSRAPYSAADVDALDAYVKRLPYLSMFFDPSGRELHVAGPHADMLAAIGRGGDYELAYLADFPYQIWPATDDWPLFFQFARPSHVWEREGVAAPVFFDSLFLLATAVSVVMVLVLVLPLWVFRKRGGPVQAPVQATLYFAGLGAGFMLVEIALAQRLALFLGHPTYGVTLVLAVLLAASAIGAVGAPRRVGSPHRAALVAALLIALSIPATRALTGALAWSMPVRVLLAVVTVAPVGIAMGVLFPAGLEHLKREREDFVAWAFGVNGVFSVLGPIVAIAVTALFGISTNLVLAALIYLGVSVLARRMRMV